MSPIKTGVTRATFSIRVDLLSSPGYNLVIDDRQVLTITNFRKELRHFNIAAQ
ncbi:MAG: hypothetical protein IPL46_30650 [Saprospiraceae bacterium]|nr:hypothetical protein [Saprospiraceae bacterium]